MTERPIPECWLSQVAAMISKAVDAETERCAYIAIAERDHWPGPGVALAGGSELSSGAAYAACNTIARKIRREPGF